MPRTTTPRLTATTAAFALACAVALAALPAAAALVDPVLVDGNPTCAGAGFSFGFKPSEGAPPVGTTTYTFPDGHNTLTVTSDGTVFSFSSTLPLDAVIVKGSSAANVYNYSPEVTADSGLHPPVNASGGWAAISHIEVCYDYEVLVSKTAVPAYTRTFTWQIEKAVAPASIAMFEGDSAAATYTVAATRSVVDGDFAVSGTITIQNPSPFDAPIASVADVLSDETVATVSCPPDNVVPAWKTMTCTYTASLGSAKDLTNTATVLTATPQVGGGKGSAAVVFGAPTTVVGPPAVTVNDSNGSSQVFTGSGSWTYSRTFTCGSDAGAHNNTATIAETGQSASATVSVACYALQVAKTAATALDRTWRWTIAKDVAAPAVTLSTGQQLLATYTVTLGTSSTDSNWAGHGGITVTNPAPIPARLDGVADVLPGGTAAVDCGVGFPYLLAAGGTLTCTWTAELPNADPRINTATATLLNSPSGATAFSGTALVDFSGAAVHPIDDCVDLADTFAGAVLPEGACAAGGPVQVFTYTRLLGPYDTCGSYTVENLASFVTDDTGATGSDGATVAVTVPCDTGCTLTPGYWKTHSSYGPAPYDDVWAMLPAGADTPFFLSGQSWYQVLWTAPAGNAYFILAHAYAASQLNVLNGASVPEGVQDALDLAREILETYTPADVAALKGGRGTQLRATILGYAWVLDQYNNGLAAGGPPHCSE